MTSDHEQHGFDQDERAVEREVHELCARLQDSVITDNEFRRLNALLDGSQSARTMYLRYVELHNLLGASSGKQLQIEAELLRQHITEGDSAALSDGRPGLQASAAPSQVVASRPRAATRLTTWAVAAVVLMAVGIGMFLVADRSAPEVALRPAENSADATLAPAGSNQAAQVSYVSPSSRWTKADAALSLRAPIRSGQRLSLDAGEVELTYQSGTKLLLVAPVDFVVGMTGGKLSRGGLMASVTQAGHGFTIETPNGEVVDLGTEFGVAVDDFGVSEVNVFQGKVDAFPDGKRGGRKKVQLLKGDGLQWTKDALTPLSADLTRFASTMLRQTPSQAEPLPGERLVDRFRAGSLDSQAWKPLGDLRASAEGLRMEGNSDPRHRPYLLSEQQFDPALGAVTITCDFRFENLSPQDTPSLAILTRSTNARGVSLPPWSGVLASCTRCSIGSDSTTGQGALQAGVKLESDREVSTVSLSDFKPLLPSTPYRIVMRDDGVNVRFTVSSRDSRQSKTVEYRSLFRGRANHVGIEGSLIGTTVVERLEISQESSGATLSSYADFSSLLQGKQRQRELETRILRDLAPKQGQLLFADNFDSGSLNKLRWSVLGEVAVRDGQLHLGQPNEKSHIDTWKPRPYLLTTSKLDASVAPITITGKIAFAENFLSGYGATFAVMTRADNQRGSGPGWENSVLRRGVRANFWPAAWNSQHSLEIHQKPTPNTVTLLATKPVQVNPQVRQYLFRVVDDGKTVALTIVAPSQPEELHTISSPATSPTGPGYLGFESCWGSPIRLDDVTVFQATSQTP